MIPSPDVAGNGNNHTNNGGYVDCQTTIIGWFQISDQVNPQTNNYLPETDLDGSVISGPGWIGYEKPGTQPGDIVLIYRVTTLQSPTAPGPGVVLSGVLWDLVNPGGLCFFNNNYALKSVVNRGDIVSQFPHAGGAATPINPDNPNGDPDIVWRNATTFYGIPGPGNADTPYYVRWVMPQFRMRLLLWSDSCCVDQSYIGPPVDSIDDGSGVPSGGPTPTPVPNPTPNPNPGFGQTIPTPLQPHPAPNNGGIDIGNLNPDGMTEPQTVVHPQENTVSQGLNPNPPQVINYNQVEISSPSRRFRKPGSAPIKRNTNDINQYSYYGVPDGCPDIYVRKTTPQDMVSFTRAVPVSPRYMMLREGGVEHHLLSVNTDRIYWRPALSIEQLNNLGLGGGEIQEAASNSFAQATPKAPMSKAGQTSVSETKKITGVIPNQDTLESSPSPITKKGGVPVHPQTRGGNSLSRQSTIENADRGGLPTTIPNTAGQYRSYTKRRLNSAGSKDARLTSRGGDVGTGGDKTGLGRRSPNLSSGSVIGAKLGSEQARIQRSRLSLTNLRKTNEPIKAQNITDSTGRFEISPVRLSNSDGFRHLLVINARNIDSTQVDAQLITNAIIQYPNGQTKVVNIGTTGYIGFGRINPPMAGQYVIANPVCTPAAGNLPDIIADGQVWDFMQLVFILQDIEQQVIAQTVLNFLPAPPNATDVQAPNRLPSGLMSSLKINSTVTPIYDGTFSHRSSDAEDWFRAEPSVIMEKVGTTSSDCALVLKATITSQNQNIPFKPLLELYNNSVLLSTENAQTAFISGPCNASPGWIDTNGQVINVGGRHTACQGAQNLGGAGGTSAFIIDQLGQIISGPFNPAIYGGSHHCYLAFIEQDATTIQTGTDYRVRVYNNGPANQFNGYAIYGQNFRAKAPIAAITINSDGKLAGNIRTFHCNQTLRITNVTTGVEIERYSSWEDGTIYLDQGPTSGSASGQTIMWLSESQLSVEPGDLIRIFKPGFDNNYNSESIVIEFTI